MNRLVACLCALMFFGSTAQAAEFRMTSEQILQVQTILFERGFVDMGLPDGKLGSKTREVIRKVQGKVDWPATGNFTEEQYNDIVSIGIPEDWVWGVVSASTNAAYHAVWNYSSGIAAYREALEKCAGECSVMAVHNKIGEAAKWIAAVWCKNGGRSGAVVAPGDTRDEAIELAYAEIEQRRGFPHSSCELRTAIASDGSHEQ